MKPMKSMILPLAFGGGLIATYTLVLRAEESAAAAEPIVVKLCDDETTATLTLASAPTTADGERVAAQLMAGWLAKNPSANWEAAQAKPVPPANSVVEPADNRHLLGDGQADGNTYRAVTDLDLKTWSAEAYAFAREGAGVFHDAGKLGSTIAVSCDMCHPDGSNTHPETYPKFQTQIGKVVLLRDMINWCIEHPVRGTKLAADDPKMRALEAYILAQRKGKALEYGRH